jgi:ubiquitin C-terminal hydrolase
VGVALTSLFSSLTTSNTASGQTSGHITTTELCKALGIVAPYTQEDAHEFKSTLLHSIDRFDIVADLFQGKLQNTVSCQDVAFNKSWDEPFIDLALEVVDTSSSTSSLLRDVFDLESSLRQYFKEEELAGENAYHVKGVGKQRAIKASRIKELPKVCI